MRCLVVPGEILTGLFSSRPGGSLLGIRSGGGLSQVTLGWGVRSGRLQDGPSFYRHVRGIAAGGEGRGSPNREAGRVR